MSTVSEPAVHYPACLGAALPGDRYTAVRNLGEIVTATNWLCRDEGINDSKYVAVKILTAEVTLDADNGVVRELEFFKEIAEKAKDRDDEGFEHLPALLDSFTLTSPIGTRHLCLVQTLFSASVSALRRSAPTKSLPVYMVRNILYMDLQALDALHFLDIIHTDVKLDNILFSNALYSLDNAMETFLAVHPAETSSDGDPPLGLIPTNSPRMDIRNKCIPSRTDDSCFSRSGTRYALLLFVSTSRFADKHIAQRAGEQLTVACFSAPALRAPEVILGTFELLVGRWLFDPVNAQPD
ncbi:hypothetical protein GYMLUDRAFT_250428 [Collybiopsis luxurians FD-317 M1]|uniref:Protein kinase domain-containing protein n=1 Tax=Collybiopsis luxurians FD-317 M1 TaxID=944289 RepID=A0A0D0BUQ7_9AGAR|nr:hypothetical protein GYMLUDRAFT_250428 [Collybiopsis luxurians FD-317 M1]